MGLRLFRMKCLIFSRRGAHWKSIWRPDSRILFSTAPTFPTALKDKIYSGLSAKYSAERKSGETDAQFVYGTRKRAFGDFKKELWNLPPENFRKISRELEERFSLMYQKLNVVNTVEMVKQAVKG